MLDKVNQHLYIAKLFIKDFFGENPPSQEEELEVWKDKHPKVSRELYDWENYLVRQEKVAKINTDLEWNKLQNRLNEEKNTRIFILGRMTKYAAAAAIFLSLGYLFFELNKERDQPKQISTTLVVKENPRGVKSQIQLPDGTLVRLNAESSISYQSNFSDTARLISLTGEAYFEVVKDAQRPFRVTSNQVETTALGTTFNIKADKPDNIEIALVEGKVKVTKRGTF